MYTQKSKGVNCVSHVALVKMDCHCQTAIDSAYSKGQLDLTLIGQSQLRVTGHTTRVISGLPLY